MRQPSQRPSIIVLNTDQQRFDTIAAGGNALMHTPNLDRLVQRGLAYAIVDEADSILIDEAVTPLIISGQAPNAVPPTTPTSRTAPTRRSRPTSCETG